MLCCLKSLSIDVFNHLTTYPKSIILLVILAIVYRLYLAWIIGPKCPEKTYINGQVVIITGANCGIGKEVAKDLVRRGGHVILACRDLKKANEAMLDISKHQYPGTCEVLQLDLQSIDSIHKFVENFKKKYNKLNILINNAGVALCEKGTTVDGFELHFGTNHLGHFLLTLLLLNSLKNSCPARVINVSSLLHKRAAINLNDLNMDNNYNRLKAYCHSKLANVYFTQELAKRFPILASFAVNPGPVDTRLSRHLEPNLQSIYNFFGYFFYKTASQGAQTIIYCAVMEDLEKDSGKYFTNCATEELVEVAKDPTTSKGLWNASVKMLEIENFVDKLYDDLKIK